MKVWRRLGWSVFAVTGLALAVLATWAATQGPDATPRPLPEALQLPPPGAPGALFADIAEPLANEPGRPAGSLHAAPLGCLPGDDCATDWLRDLAAVATQLRANAQTGARCEAALAALHDGAPYVEWLPERLGPSQAIPALVLLPVCQRWLVGQALMAAAAADEVEAARRLRQSDDWVRAALGGARSLIGHQTAYRQAHLHLQAVAAVALLQPGWATTLQTVVAPWPAEWLHPARWMAHEAAFARGAVDELDAQCGAPTPTPTPAPATGAAHAQSAGLDIVDFLVGLLCRHRLGWQPEATRQRFDAIWLDRIERLREGPARWLEAAQQRRATGAVPEPGPGWAWRNTLGVLITDGARDNALYDTYVASPVDLDLHRQLLAATLALRRAAVAAPERQAWLARHAALQAEVLARVRWEPDGRALRWRTWAADLVADGMSSTPRTPSRIAIDADG